MDEKAPLFSIEPADENIVGAPDWAGIESEYRSGKPLRAISEQFGIGKDAIARRAKRDCWQRGATNTATDARQGRDNAAINDTVSPVVAHAVSRDDDEFDWRADDIVVFHEMPRTAIYWNTQGALVIRQQRYYPDEDVFVFIAPDSIASFLDKLTDFVGIPSVGG